MFLINWLITQIKTVEARHRQYRKDIALIRQYQAANDGLKAAAQGLITCSKVFADFDITHAQLDVKRARATLVQLAEKNNIYLED